MVSVDILSPLTDEIPDTIDILPPLTEWGTGILWIPQSDSFEVPTESGDESS